MQTVLRQDRNGAAYLTLNRPDKLNALNVTMFRELRAHVEQIAQETDKVGVVVVRGAGKCFCAGNDLQGIAAGDVPPRPFYQSETVEALASLPQPVISAVHGHCYTGGLELALAGDLIVAAESAKFADTHARWSLTPIWGMSQRLPRRVGAARARRMMFTCRTVPGAEALTMGLADYCFPDATFAAELDKLVDEMVALSWFSHRNNKKLLMDTDGLPLSAGLAHEIYKSAGRGPDSEARIAGFMAKGK